MRVLPLCLLLPLALAACTDARGLNAYEARCIDRDALQRGTPAFGACAAREEQRFVDEFRREHRTTGSP